MLDISHSSYSNQPFLHPSGFDIGYVPIGSRVQLQDLQMVIKKLVAYCVSDEHGYA